MTDLTAILSSSWLRACSAASARSSVVMPPSSAAPPPHVKIARVYDPRGRSPPGGTMRVEIICTGDEVLTGKIVNSNFSYMSQKLEDVGLSVAWETTVGDDRESL